MGKDERALNVSGYVYRGEVKYTDQAFNKVAARDVGLAFAQRQRQQQHHSRERRKHQQCGDRGDARIGISQQLLH
jgi:hypothetical protein